MYLDLHLHILPDVDDGAIDVEEAVEMGAALASSGFSAAVATPHIRADLFPNEPAVLLEEAAALATAFSSNGVALELMPGAEHYLDEDVFEALLEGRGLPLGGSGGVYLVEVPMERPVPALFDQIFRLRMKGGTPLIAHPERCLAFHDEGLAQRAVEAGAHFQLNLGSLAGVFGRHVRKVAKGLLRGGLYSVASTDLHDGRSAREQLPRWMDALERAVGAEARDRLLANNPRRLLSGEPIDPVKRSW